MLSSIINFSIRNKFLVFLLVLLNIGYGLFSLIQIPVGAVPDVTNNQVQVITTSTSLSTREMEKFITYPVELEMVNLPGVKEIRSVSKFGLSVVTIVFEDDMGTYLPRQLIAEKIKSASEKIPEGFGNPEMGPITTGLGEIYQYTLEMEPAYKGKYTSADLRTIQDWIVKRQLSGIPGVVEVNTWGGKLKQYEIAIDTRKLNAMEISAGDVFSALEKNNSVTGGGYIEKENQAYFIRGEGLVGSLEDIRSIVVDNKDGTPILIKDIAEVGFGSAVRFGAITGNGEGEKVLGQVMMLKDANSKKVIEAVKTRVTEISPSLPEGIYINPFLDRSELIGRTTSTVIENLIFGCLIVVFVVVLLLGNFRSGLVVASVIPLSLLFALSMMYIFGIDANLMSLGAIDFGIIIDGAVIIVEYTAYQITKKRSELLNLKNEERSEFKDEVAAEAGAKMMNSAIFGQLIILIVFIPILSLSGVEGKMFRPMALTFSFALIGAIILCLTYVPVISSLLLKPARAEGRDFAGRLMKKLMSWYEPTLHWALQRKKLVLGAAGSLLVFAIIIFSTMGGEFVPTLDEGDFVIQPILKTGTSLSETIETTTQIEKILLKEFPEVKQVVTRIGAAEVPTDPMSMEESDVIIILHPKNTWTSARSKDELAEKFKEALLVIPGIEIEFTQPIEMRFNELITGVRADIAIKVFGEDLDILLKKGEEIRELIKDVEGAADITVEKIAGLPQMNVSYDRSRIARFGLNIEDLNKMVSAGFSGSTVGSVFEGEKKFDLVVRLKESQRRGIEDLKNLYIDVPSGGKIPLSQVADITYQKEAAKISRDNSRRRIVVGINVRNRDLQSVVDDVRMLIERDISLPVGYTLSYGGQFENLQSAKARLKIAVPIALLLIFVLLYFTFNSLREAILIYSAIPLAAIGGVFLLWIRDMPFSISAGIGFIALFGIAVLNGIVLIEHFKELKTKGLTDMETLIKQGTKDRLRPVLLTASAAALGFLPMAISTNAGAEVQRPLATVVIGGLVSATLLTLVVLPVLYCMFEKVSSGKLKRRGRFKKSLGVLIILFSISVQGQSAPRDLDGLIPIALENNAGLNASWLRYERSEVLKGTAFEFDKTEIYYTYNENNLAVNGFPVDVFGIRQDFLFPSVYGARRKVQKTVAAMEKDAHEVRKKNLIRDLASAYYEYQVRLEKELIYTRLDSIYRNFDYAAGRRFELGETNYLEKITASSKQRQVAIQKDKAAEEVELALKALLQILQAGDTIEILREPYRKVELVEPSLQDLPEMTLYRDKALMLKAENQLEKQRLLPDIALEYFQGSNETLDGNLNGYLLGLKIPVFFSGQASRIKASSLEKQAFDSESAEYEILLRTRLESLKATLLQNRKALSYYEKEGKDLANEILRTAISSFKNGEIDFFQYIQSLENAYGILLNYLDSLNDYNQTIININYLTL
ncbi:cobalt-zinc-cadmium resistance protein CzcA [Muriicola jejuensis]|uniref:CusA/CzcA family heavy metal efflux RND transporter n=1 Tax=Muriicola jejuensis TaxID=504488 RepID=A0A6P0UB54_9FLAO|nr:CusA/CzcA family heavy metal efflux RND transporter [Muriicola jejuensis]NER09730.1 CusA/CzcA family heavy metal efflux RND transporter [Muriicola jejuensis]SMP06242.1 cobalt-zinc-cadmium resistance protein CzcA [Muriicola jejuensis]